MISKYATVQIILTSSFTGYVTAGKFGAVLLTGYEYSEQTVLQVDRKSDAVTSMNRMIMRRPHLKLSLPVHYLHISIAASYQYEPRPHHLDPTEDFHFGPHGTSDSNWIFPSLIEFAR